MNYKARQIKIKQKAKKGGFIPEDFVPVGDNDYDVKMREQEMREQGVRILNVKILG